MILLGPAIWEPSGVQAHSRQRDCIGGTEDNAPIPSTDPSTGLGAGKTQSHSLEDVGRLAEKSDECRDREEMGHREEE